MLGDLGKGLPLAEPWCFIRPILGPVRMQLRPLAALTFSRAQARHLLILLKTNWLILLSNSALNKVAPSLLFKGQKLHQEAP